nr:barstar family protein [Tissierella sp.]
MEKTEKIILDGNYMKTREKTHEYLKKKLQLPDYYGNNLDALWDILSTCSEGMDIDFINKERLIDYLGEYGRTMLEVFKDAELENKYIKFREKSLF